MDDWQSWHFFFFFDKQAIVLKEAKKPQSIQVAYEATNQSWHFLS